MAVEHVRAPNPGPMTLEGTNTWIVGSAVIDPGPLDEEHLSAVLSMAQARAVDVVLLTHGHADHSEGAARFAELAGCAVRAYDEAYTISDRTGSNGDRTDDRTGAKTEDGRRPPQAKGLRDGDVVAGLEVLHVPGHTSDSVAFWSPAERVLFTGDTVLGRGTSIIAHPDGALGPYLASLRRLREFVGEHEVVRILPGHGPQIDDPAGVLDFYLAHRKERLAQVSAALDAGATTAREVVERVYADVDRSLWPAAELSVLAQLEYLRPDG